MWLLVSEWLQSIPQIAVCRHTPYWAIPPLILCDKQQEPSWDAAERAQERREDALSSPPPLRKVTGAQDSLPLHFSSAFLPAPPQPSLTTVIIMNGYGANPEVSAASSQRLRFTPFECVRPPPPSGAVVEISSFESSSAFPFLKCVSLVSLCSSCASTSSAATLRLIFRALHPPWRASLQSPSRLTSGGGKKKKEKRAKCARWLAVY